jgi:Domain of unknown function (DUF4476)
MKNKFLILFLLLSAAAFSQRNHFIYLQSDPQEPFFIRMNEKIFSSTASGYIILANLTDSINSFTVGFPQNKFPQQKFSVITNKKDQGVLLKNFGEKGWGLFNLQTLAVQMPADNAVATKVVEEEKVNDFTELLSKATNDSTLRQKTITEDIAVKPAEEKKPDAVVQLPAINTVAKNNDSLNQLAKQKDTISKPAVSITPQLVDTPAINKTQQPASTESVISKIFQVDSGQAAEVIFTDKYEDGSIDTIRIQIPNIKVKEIVETKIESKEAEPVKKDTIAESANTKVDSPKKDTITQSSNIKKDSLPVVKPENKAPVINQQLPRPGNQCAAKATDADFIKIRRRMAGETNDDNMIYEAKKYFKTKCFSTLQVKGLSGLFISDAGKYNFFDAVFKYVYDIENFSSLQSELKDEYYIKRFKVMLD